MKTILASLLAFAVLAGALPAAPTAVDADAYQKNLRAIRARRLADEKMKEAQEARVALAEKRERGLVNEAVQKKETAEVDATAETAEKDAAAAEADAPKIPSDEVLKMLRDKGFGITGGYGQLTRSGTRLATLQIRYNLFQRDATTYQVRTYRDQPEKQVSYGGKNKVFEFANRSAARGQELTDMSDLTLPASVLSGVYLWAGWTNTEVTFGAEKSKPLFAGLSAGFGPLEKGASTVHLDVGLAFYNNSKMPKDDIYVGLSVDVELFKKLVSAF